MASLKSCSSCCSSLISCLPIASRLFYLCKLRPRRFISSCSALCSRFWQWDCHILESAEGWHRGHRSPSWRMNWKDPSALLSQSIWPSAKTFWKSHKHTCYMKCCFCIAYGLQVRNNEPRLMEMLANSQMLWVKLRTDFKSSWRPKERCSPDLCSSGINIGTL